MMFLKTCLEKGESEKKDEMKFLPRAVLPAQREGRAAVPLLWRGPQRGAQPPARLAPAASPQEGTGLGSSSSSKHQ